MQWLSILHTIAKGVKGKGRLYIIYEQDIVCLPKWFGKELIHIPRKKAVRHLLAKNKLVGKVQLKSHMNEEKIFMEICLFFVAQWVPVQTLAAVWWEQQDSHGS